MQLVMIDAGGRPVARTRAVTLSPSSGRRSPMCTRPGWPRWARIVISSLLSARMRPTCAAPRSRPISITTASNTSVGVAPCATRVATRRSADCSLARRSITDRASLLRMAVAASSVNCANRGSTSGGSSLLSAAAIMAPQGRPATTIGAPTAARVSTRRAASPIIPDPRVAKSSRRRVCRSGRSRR